MCTLFTPDHLVDNSGVGLDELDDFGRDAFVCVVGDREAEVSFAVHLHGYVHCLKQGCFVDSCEDEVSFVKGLGTFGGGSDAHGCDGFADGEEEAALFRKSSGVADDGEGVHLQVVVVVEAEWLMGYYAAVEFESALFKSFA